MPARREQGIQENQGRSSIAATTNPWLDESSKPADVLYERTMSSLDKRRVEIERGAGGDHDLPYTFTLPTSIPEVLVWMKLLARVQNGACLPKIP
jgi:hypothetical protein